MQTQFKTLPATQELAQVERDLRFHPSTVTDPQLLSPEQVEGFNRDGYVRRVRVYDEAEATDNRAYFDALLARVVAEGGDSYSISTAHMRYGRVWDILTHPRIARVVKDLLGEDVVGWGSHFFCKMPGDGKQVHWHQDASYWPLTPSKTVTVWLAIDDADRENACMRVIPGTHHLGHLTYRMTEDRPDAVLNQEVEGAEDFGAPIDLELRAGEVSVHADLTLHGSEPNRSDRRRCGLTLRYCAADVVAGLGWDQKGVWLGEGPCPPQWGNPPRPEE